MKEWDVIDKYFQSTRNYLTKHQLDSFNYFLNEKIVETIRTFNPIIQQKDNSIVEIWIGGKDGSDISLMKPDILPNTARLESKTYNCEIIAQTIDIIITQDNNKKEFIEKNKVIGKIPVMLQSDLCNLKNLDTDDLIKFGECPYDQGGYFIIDGKEKVVISQEEFTQNKLTLAKPTATSSKYELEGEIKSASDENKLFVKTIKFFMEKKRRGKPPILTTNTEGKNQQSSTLTSINYNNNDKKNDTVSFSIFNNTHDNDQYNKNNKFDKAHPKRLDVSNHITVSIPSFKNKNIPVFILFRAIGIESDRSILEYIANDEDMKDDNFIRIVKDCIIDSQNSDLIKYDIRYINDQFIDNTKYIYTQSDALNYLKNQINVPEYLKDKIHSNNNDDEIIKFVKFVLARDFLPHMNSFSGKAFVLGSLVNQIIKTHLGLIPFINKDNYANKRIRVSGHLLSNVFRDQYNNLRKEILNRIPKDTLSGKIDEIQLRLKKKTEQIFEVDKITEGMYKTFKGNWGLLNDPSLSGRVQDLNRLSYVGYISHVRRINTPLDRELKLTTPRRLGTEQFGFMCPLESPDGENIGLLKHLSVSCEITKELSKTTNNMLNKELFEDENFFVIEQKENDIFLSKINSYELLNNTKILLNNKIIGYHTKPFDLIEKLKQIKSNTKEYKDIYQITFFYNFSSNELKINTDSGRCIRPLFIKNMYNEISTLKFNNWYDAEFLGKFIEYVDVEESNYLLINMNKKVNSENVNYTHSEIHPCLTLSYYTNSIPFVNHNPSARIVFSGQQGKQALGIYSTSFNNRIDTASYILHYPQKNLVASKLSKYIHKDKLPNGENLIVAIATYTGYNQEDSIIFNKDSIDRGLFNVTSFKSIIDNEFISDDNRMRVKFKNPENFIDKKKLRLKEYKTIDENGIPYDNTYIHEGFPMLGKIKEIDLRNQSDIFDDKTISNTEYKDATIIADKTNYSTVDKKKLFNKNNQTHIKIRTRKMKKPALGDKAASQHGQKGVVGMILPQVEMPFTKDGLVPDIIINPHAIPSRMTLGHLLETIFNRTACNLGSIINNAPFDSNSEYLEQYFNYLQNSGYDKYSNEVMYNARTGHQITTNIFVGPTYYYRLKHMVSDKINYRHNQNAPIENLSKQPTQGRSNSGGLRIGEMETNAICSHGMNSFLKESLNERSDGTKKLNKNDFNEINLNMSGRGIPHYIYCDDHGDEVISNEKLNIYEYPTNNNKDVTSINKYRVPYSFRLLKHELQSIGIKMNLINDKNNAYDNTYDNTYDDNEIDSMNYIDDITDEQEDLNID